MGGGGAPDRNLYDEISGELKAKRDNMPGIMGSESLFRPQFSGLEMNNLNDILFGSKGGTRTVEYTEPVQSYLDNKTGQTIDNPSFGNRWKNNKRELESQYTPFTKLVTKTRSEDYGPTPGLLKISQQLDPQGTTLWNKLNQNASSDLDMGANLDPDLMRLAQQTVRARQQGTLAGTGDAGNYGEALGVSQFANDLRNQRRAFATSIANMDQTRADAMLNRAYGISAGSGPRLFGSTVNANDVFSSNQNAAAANNAANSQMTTAGIGAAAGILAALI